MTLIDELRVLQRELLAHDGWRARGAFVYQAISALEAAEGWRSAWHTARNLSEHIADERDALKAQRDSLTEQLGLARKDAERYRWLRDASPNSTFNTPTVVDGFRGIDDHCTMLEGVVLDAAIDAALASQAVPR